MSKRVGAAFVASCAVLMGLSGCATETNATGASEWLPPVRVSSTASLPSADHQISRDVVEVAGYSTLIVRGHFVAKLREVDGAALFGPESPVTEEQKALASARRARTLAVWDLSVDKVVKGDSAFTGTVIHVLVELQETDVPGVVVDPTRVGKHDVVVMLHAVPVETLPFGPAYWNNGSGQLGAGFQIVNGKGRLSVDPWAKIPLRSERPDVSASASLEQQLDLSAGT